MISAKLRNEAPKNTPAMLPIVTIRSSWLNDTSRNNRFCLLRTSTTIPDSPDTESFSSVRW